MPRKCGDTSNAWMRQVTRKTGHCWRSKHAVGSLRHGKKATRYWYITLWTERMAKAGHSMLSQWSQTKTLHYACMAKAVRKEDKRPQTNIYVELVQPCQDIYELMPGWIKGMAWNSVKGKSRNDMSAMKVTTNFYNLETMKQTICRLLHVLKSRGPCTNYGTEPEFTEEESLESILDDLTPMDKILWKSQESLDMPVLPSPK